MKQKTAESGFYSWQAQISTYHHIQNSYGACPASDIMGTITGLA